MNRLRGVPGGAEPDRRTVAVVSAGLREPSSTRLLADRLADAAVEALRGRGVEAEVRIVDLRRHAAELTTMLLTGVAGRGLAESIAHVAGADGLIAVSPIYSGSYTGLFKNFFDVLDEGVLAGMPTVLAATAGTARHSLAIEHTMRPLMAYLGALSVPTGVFAATDDFGHSSGVRTDDDVAPLAERVTAAASELAELVGSRPPRERRDPMALTEDFEDLLRGG